MPSMPTPASIDEYVAGFPPEIQEKLEEIRALVRTVAPAATETISYAIPTFDLNGKHLVHFAGYTHHIAVYPAPGGDAAFKEDLAPYWNGKGTAQFPLDQPLPLGLIRRIVEFRVERVAG